MKYSKLSNICEYRNEKIDISLIDNTNYVSTENMLPNKCGVTIATSLPNSKRVKRYFKGDTLVSNIRPYFKKIWRATKDGGCSNDILIFSAKKDINKDFLYYILSDDAFFEYGMSTSKGTKMPRGDKLAIMKYLVPSIDIFNQKKIANILRSLDDKIELNNAINKNLEEQAFALFESYFPNFNIGKHKIGDYIIPKRGKNLSSKNTIFGYVPVVAGGLEPSTYHNIANTVAPVITISASGANSGFVQLWDKPIWSSDSSFIDFKMTQNIYFWYAMLKIRQKEIYDSQTGSAQPHVYPKHISVMSAPKLDLFLVDKYTNQVTPLFKLIGINKAQSDKLMCIRNTLIPKLMSGEIDVSEIDI